MAAPGHVHQITVKGSGDFFERFHKVKAAELRADSSQPWAEFNGMLNGLLAWARREGLIRGQRNRSLEPVQRALRNIVAHGEYHLGTPVDAARELSDLAEFINHLWGQPTPGGRLYPAPLRREIVAIGWSTDGESTTAGYADQLADARDEEKFTYILVKAVFCPGGLTDPHLLDFDARHASTAFPTTFLWGPGPREEATTWLSQNQPEPDLYDYLDQILLVRAHDDRVDPPVYPGVAAGLPAAEQQGVWYAVRVDSSPRRRRSGACERGRVQTVPCRDTRCRRHHGSPRNRAQCRRGHDATDRSGPAHAVRRPAQTVGDLKVGGRQATRRG